MKHLDAVSAQFKKELAIMAGGGINVEHYGAVGDAVQVGKSWTGTDNTAAILAAIEDAKGTGYSTLVHIPRGNFLCKELDLSSDGLVGLVIQGGGWDTRLIGNEDNTTTGMLNIGRSRITIRDIILDGNAGEFDSNIIFIDNENAWQLKVENAMFVNCTQHAIKGDSSTSNSAGNLSAFERCVFQGGDLGFVLLSHANRTHIQDCIFQSGGVTAGLPYAIKVTSDKPAPWKHSFKLENCWFEFQGTDHNTADFGIGNSNVVTPIILDAYGVRVTDNRIVVNSAVTTCTSGIELTSAGDHCQVAYNTFVECGFTAPNILVKAGNQNSTLEKNRGLWPAAAYNATMVFEDNHGTSSVNVTTLNTSSTTTEIETNKTGFSSPSMFLTSRTKGENPVAWISETRGHLAPDHADTTAYTRGKLVNSGGYIYMCITDGTSGTGTPPTSTTINSDETDGTAHWTYMGVQGAFITTADVITEEGYWTAPGP